MTGPLLLCAVAFVIAAPLGGWVVAELMRRGIGKRIRYDGPESHQAKEGTPTMGGVHFVAAMLIIAVGLGIAGYTLPLLPMLAMLGFCLLGAFDDLAGLADARGVGWLARSKFWWQVGLSAVLALAMFWIVDDLRMVVPVLGRKIELGWGFVPVAIFLLLATSNAVNLTDGLDGLAAGTSAIAFAAYGTLAWVGAQRGLSLFCLGLVGALLSFLWYNGYPAQVFMGDTGSEALGAGLATVALLTGHWLLLPVIGVIFAGAAFSVILQVAYFKYTRRRYGEGRRIFRMAPLHHHFEHVGWPEVQITQRFWIVSAVASALGVALGIGR